jgi:hypothetical protein
MTAEYDVHRKSYKYSFEDWQLLVNILHEYSEKLLSISRQLSKNEKNSNSTGVNSKRIVMRILSIFSVVGIVLLTVYSYNRDKTLLMISSYLVTAIVSMTFSTSLFIALNSSLIKITRKNTENVSDNICFSPELIKKDARVMASRLESAIRLTITVADQIEISLAKKLEMDLRIDEASYALECYYSVSGEEPRTYQVEHKY